MVDTVRRLVLVGRQQRTRTADNQRAKYGRILNMARQYREQGEMCLFGLIVRHMDAQERSVRLR